MPRAAVLVLALASLAATTSAQDLERAGPARDEDRFTARVRAALPRQRVQRVLLWAENDSLVQSGDRYYTNAGRSSS